MPICILLSV